MLLQEDTAYQSESIPETHPGRLFAIARLFGLKTPSLERMRVLEIGCSSANNLLPLACMFPEASFVGVDIDVAAIKKAERVIEALDLKNVQLVPEDFRDLDRSDEFDLIIAHGVYSWIDGPAREALLELLSDQLSEDGILYLSYNTFPGWHLRLAVREMLLSAAASTPPAEAGVTAGGKEGLQRARRFASSLRSALQRNPSRMGEAMTEQLLLVESFPDWFLAHDILGKENHPQYLSSVVEAARETGLQYLGDAELKKMAPVDIDELTVAELSAAQPAMIELEQTLDYLRMETFRRSLFCRKSVALKHHEAIARIPELSFQSPLREAKSESPDTAVFLGPARARLETSEQIVIDALRFLSGIFPKAARYEEIKAVIKEKHGNTENLDAVLTQTLFRCLVAGLLYPWVWTPPVSREPGERPEAFRFARFAASDLEGGATPIVSFLHTTLNLNEEERKLLAMLDGTRLRAEFEANPEFGEMLRAFSLHGLLMNSDSLPLDT